MPITTQLLQTRRIDKIGIQNTLGVVRTAPTVNHEQRVHAFADARCTHAVVPVGKTIEIHITHDANGDGVYIPWGMGEIHSVDIPANQLNNISYFFTAQMQGCQLIVDRMTDGSYRFHHANSLQSPTAQQSATQPTFQTQATLNDLAALHGLTRPPAQAAVQIAQTQTLSKADYFSGVNLRLATKRANGRTGINYLDPEHVSFTYVIGFRTNQWSVWYQTASQFFYDRPTRAIFLKTRVEPKAGKDVELVEAVQAFQI